MREELDYIKVPGNNTGHEVRVYALSTCGFCKRGMEFLETNNINFDYIYIDSLPLETKRELKDELLDVSGKRVAFPMLVINNETYLVGFVEDDWKKALGLSS